LNERRLASILGRRTARDRLARDLRDAARCAAAELWLVGGYVRDAALGRRATDLDLVSGRGSRRLIAELRRRWSTGGFRFRKRGITTWRFDFDGRSVDIVDASRRGLRRDLLRRDFTVNAIAFDLASGAVLDPLGGLAHLRARRLRLPRAEALREDPLRALRAARLLAQLPRFTLDPEVERGVAGLASGLRRVAGERVRAELDKLLAAPDPRRGLACAEKLGVVAAVLPELVALRCCKAGAGRPDVWRHTLDAIDRSRSSHGPGAQETRGPDELRLLRWSLLLHDISKPETYAVRADGRPTFHGHEALGARRASALLERLRVPGHERQRICRLILNHLRPGHLADAGAPRRGLSRLVREAGADLPLLVRHAACDALASGSPDAGRRWRLLRRVLADLFELWRARRDRTALPRLVDGRELMHELGIEPGPRVGRLLARIHERQAQGRLSSKEEALAWLRRLARRGPRPRAAASGEFEDG